VIALVLYCLVIFFRPSYEVVITVGYRSGVTDVDFYSLGLLLSETRRNPGFITVDNAAVYFSTEPKLALRPDGTYSKCIRK